MMTLIVALGVAFLTALTEAMLLADQNRHLRSKLDREATDRETAARAFAADWLRDVAKTFRRHTAETADAAHWRAFNEAADRIESHHIPQLLRPVERGGR